MFMQVEFVLFTSNMKLIMLMHLTKLPNVFISKQVYGENNYFKFQKGNHRNRLPENAFVCVRETFTDIAENIKNPFIYAADVFIIALEIYSLLDLNSR